MYELEDVTVLDLTTGIGGPYATMLLGDAGADVIKIEPVAGDSSRGMPPFVNGESSIFLSLNRNKRSVAVDVSTPEGQDVARRLAKRVDMIVEDRGQREMRRLGLDYDAIARDNATAVYCTLTDFGERGPMKDLPGSELAVQAMAEFWASLGTIGEPPLRTGADLAEMNAGLIAFDGIMAAYLYRLTHGVGQRVATNKLVSLLHHRGTLWAAQSDPDEWFGFHLDNYVKPPEYAYQTKDLPVYFSLRSGTQDDFDRLLIRLGMHDALGDPRFAGGREAIGLGRYAHEVKHMWEAAFKDLTADEVIEIIKEHRGEPVVVNNLESLQAHEQMQTFDVLRQFEHPVAGTVTVAGQPWKFNGLSEARMNRPPLLGEHTDEVLADLGFDAAAIAAMRARGAAK